MNNNLNKREQFIINNKINLELGDTCFYQVKDNKIEKIVYTIDLDDGRYSKKKTYEESFKTFEITDRRKIEDIIMSSKTKDIIISFLEKKLKKELKKEITLNQKVQNFFSDYFQQGEDNEDFLFFLEDTGVLEELYSWKRKNLVKVDQMPSYKKYIKTWDFSYIENIREEMKEKFSQINKWELRKLVRKAQKELNKIYVEQEEIKKKEEEERKRQIKQWIEKYPQLKDVEGDYFTLKRKVEELEKLERRQELLNKFPAIKQIEEALEKAWNKQALKPLTPKVYGLDNGLISVIYLEKNRRRVGEVMGFIKNKVSFIFNQNEAVPTLKFENLKVVNVDFKCFDVNKCYGKWGIYVYKDCGRINKGKIIALVK